MSDDRVTAQQDDLTAVAAYIADYGPVTRDQVARGLGLRGQVARQLIRHLIGDRVVVQSSARRGIPTYTSAPGWRPAESAISVTPRPTDDTPTTADAAPDASSAGAAPDDDANADTTASDSTADSSDVAARETAVLELLTANTDGMTTAAVAAELDITSDKAYRAIDSLRNAGRVTKTGADGRAAVWAATT